MSKIIIYSHNNQIAICYPTGEISIEEVLVKDCPKDAIIIDSSELPLDNTFFNAWELIDGKVIVNEDKKQTIIKAQQDILDTKQNALNKLMSLGLTEQEALSLGAV